MDYRLYSMVSRLFVLVFFCSQTLLGQQDTLNQTNVRGLKTGFWRVYHKTHPKSRHYEGRFENGKKLGKFLYYNKKDQLVAHRIYFPKDTSYVYFLDKNQQVIGQGGFKGNKKSGKWTYLDENQNKVREDEFRYGVLNGLSLLYDKETQHVIIKQYYKRGFQHGPFERYDPNGKLVIKGQYVNGKLDGHTTYFNPETGHKEIEGKYVGGVRKGEWKFYLNGVESHTEMYP